MKIENSRGTRRFAACVMVALAFAHTSFGGGQTQLNMPGCDKVSKECCCSEEEASAGCIKVNFGLGETTPWTGSMPCSLKIFADDDSPSVFTLESMHAVLGGYCFKRLGTKNLADGATPAGEFQRVRPFYICSTVYA